MIVQCLTTVWSCQSHAHSLLKTICWKTFAKLNLPGANCKVCKQGVNEIIKKLGKCLDHLDGFMHLRKSWLMPSLTTHQPQNILYFRKYFKSSAWYSSCLRMKRWNKDSISLKTPITSPEQPSNSLQGALIYYLFFSEYFCLRFTHTYQTCNEKDDLQHNLYTHNLSSRRQSLFVKCWENLKVGWSAEEPEVDSVRNLSTP